MLRGGVYQFRPAAGATGHDMAILLILLVADMTATSLAFSSGDGGVLRLQGTTYLSSSQRLPVSRSPPMLSRSKEDCYVSLMR